MYDQILPAAWSEVLIATAKMECHFLRAARCRSWLWKLFGKRRGAADGKTQLRTGLSGT